MAEQEGLVTPAPMLANIQAQPASHQKVLELQQGSQRATLLACADVIRKATGKVFFTGMGGSLFATVAAFNRLWQHGSPVQLLESSEQLHFGAAGLRAEDVGVVISRSGESIEPVLLAEKMRQAGMKVIGVTNVPGSRLERIAHHTLMIGSQADNLIAVQTYTGTALTLLLLAEEILSGTSSQLADACHAALPRLATYIKENIDACDSWQSLLQGQPLYLLGRGPALGAVHEGALLLHETAKAPAVGMSSGQFRHGPAELLAGDFRAVIFGTAPQTQALEESLARDFIAAAAKVCWIGPAQSREVAALSPAPWPEIPATLAPLFEIVPLQVAAYRFALSRGITPGDFRFVSEVTATESGFHAPGTSIHA